MMQGFCKAYVAEDCEESGDQNKTTEANPRDGNTADDATTARWNLAEF